jgi:hypothetical protein
MCRGFACLRNLKKENNMKKRVANVIDVLNILFLFIFFVGKNTLFETPFVSSIMNCFY